MKRMLMLTLIFFTVELSAQKVVSTTPFELFGDHIFISLSVDNSEPLSFIFDTGDGLSVIDLDVAKNLGLSMDHKASKSSAQGSISGALIEHNKIEMNDIVLQEIELYSTDLSHLEASIGRNIDGIIGYDLLKNYVIEVDYTAMEFHVYEADSYTYSGDGETIKFKLNSYIPHISCTVKLNNGESYSDEFFINTGAGTTMDFNTVFAEKHKVVEKTGEHYSYPVTGLGNKETQHYEGRVMSFGFGSTTIENLPIGISQAKHGIQHNKKVAGIIGNDVLNRFNITYDYKNLNLYVEPNEKLTEPFWVNASGLNLQLDQSGKVLIHRVFEDSPASSAGLMVDDEVVSVNGKSVDAYSLPELRKMLKSDGETLRMEVLQKGVKKEVTFELSTLI